MKYLAWVLFGISALVLLGSIPVSLQFWDVYGYPQSVGEWWSESWWVFALAAIPAIAGYLVLRVARDRAAARREEDRT